MMKKILVLVIFVCATTISTFAQNGNGVGLGARIGLTAADFTGSTGESRVGFVGGLFVDYSISRFGFEAGLYYSQQGSFKVADMRGDDNRADYKLDYLDLQVLVKYQIFNGFRVFAGPSVGFLLNSTISYKDGAQSVTQKISTVRKYDVGIVGGAGYTFRFGLDVAASYTYGFSDLFLPTNKEAHTSMFKVTVGWSFLRSLNKNR